ncbi:extracellular solute-binding protein [Streptomyces sp. NPDC056464]|uniref:extracellular solute-binding protein n=1 Tax=Streptomyces sp. NPDC056464 TaxID=3345828 RepID=UPI0036B286AE
MRGPRSRGLTARLARCALVVGLLLAAAACGEPGKDRVTIMVPWSDTEFKAFYSVIKAFERDNPGIDVEPQITRALTQQLDAAVAADAAPDLAVLPSVGAIAKYQKQGELKPLEVRTESYVEPFRSLGMREGKVYAVPVKADVKSLVWYVPKAVVPPPPENWPALRARPETWCLGLESGLVSGWPGADWIADILLAEEGADTYEAWVSGRLKWNSQQVDDAWTAWGDLIESGDPEAASIRKFSDATDQMADRTCSLGHGALSAMGLPADGVRDGTYTFVTPSPKALEVSADFVGKFSDSTSAERLIAYLASESAQRTWVNRPGYAISANERVTGYADPAQARIADMLRSGHTLCFSAADAMDPDVTAAFYRAVLDYANGKDLEGLLDALERVQQTAERETPAFAAPEPLCATPSRP